MAGAIGVDEVEPPHVACNYKSMIPKLMDQLMLLNHSELLVRWIEEKNKNGIRFGGVGVVLIEGTGNLGFVNVAGNDLPNVVCAKHGTNMGIYRVQRATNVNVRFRVYYKCTDMETEVLMCGFNSYPYVSKAKVVADLDDATLGNYERPLVMVLPLNRN